MTLKVSEKTRDILSYESEVWTSADVLRSSAGLKGSQFPSFMMPFFALRMIESRLIRKYSEVCQDPELTNEQDRIDEVRENVGFYNALVIEKKTTLIDIVQNDKTFYTDFYEYLNAFDPEMKKLLGVIEPDPTENLNIMSVVKSLKSKKALFGYVTAWAKIDFTPYDNAEITTLEEHIKRKWSDMEASEAGEHYTPFDIIELIYRLAASKPFKENYPYKIYDMTCGGGNMLYGVEDHIKKTHKNINTQTYGQELNGQLYALARIESMFRKDSYIERGNTLTEDKFPNQYFDIGVANPPYGISWKEEEKQIKTEQSGRFDKAGGYPSVSDAQLLFVEHMLAKLNDTGRAYIVLNGSPLFSGDAGSGESSIRKWILDNDYLEALIQLPTEEFFNTKITTYLWCLNKNKESNRKDKVLCVNAENEFVKLKKNKGDKSKEISHDQAKKLVKIYKDFSESDISKVLSKYDFYFNKQQIERLEKDPEFGAFNDGGESKTLKDVSFINLKNKTNEEAVGFSAYNIENPGSDLKEFAEKLNSENKSFNPESQNILIITKNKESYSLSDSGCIIKSVNGVETNLGLGSISFKAKYIPSKKSKKGDTAEKLNVEVTISPIRNKDYEKIEYSPIEKENDKLINGFMSKWVSENSEDYKLLNNTVGVEINFNSVFPKKMEIRSTAEILKEMEELNKQIAELI